MGFDRVICQRHLYIRKLSIDPDCIPMLFTSAPHEPILGVTAPLIDCRRILMICIGLSNAFAINLIMSHPFSGVFIMKYKISKFWLILVPRCGSVVVRVLGTSPGRSLVRVRAIAFCGKTWLFHDIWSLPCSLSQTARAGTLLKNSNWGWNLIKIKIPSTNWNFWEIFDYV